MRAGLSCRSSQTGIKGFAVGSSEVGVLCLCSVRAAVCHSPVVSRVSLLGSSAAGVFMGPTNLPFTSQAPAAFPGFPSMGVPVPAAPGLVGSSLGPSPGMMVGMPVPNGFMGSTQTAVMPLAQGVVGPPGMVAHMGTAQGKFGLQPAPQSPWNLPQVGTYPTPHLSRVRPGLSAQRVCLFLTLNNLAERIE